MLSIRCAYKKGVSIRQRTKKPHSTHQGVYRKAAKAAPARPTVRPAEPPLRMAPAALEDDEVLLDWVLVEEEVEVESEPVVD